MKGGRIKTGHDGLEFSGPEVGPVDYLNGVAAVAAVMQKSNAGIDPPWPAT